MNITHNCEPTIQHMAPNSWISPSKSSLKLGAAPTRNMPAQARNARNSVSGLDTSKIAGINNPAVSHVVAMNQFLCSSL